MSTFKLEVGGNCANGADVVYVHRGSKGGVVLATWRREYVTWVFPLSDESSTAHGNYFLYGADTSMEEALEKAQQDYLNRVGRYL